MYTYCQCIVFRHRHKLSFEEYFTQYIEGETPNGSTQNPTDHETSSSSTNPKIKKKYKYPGLLPLADSKNSKVSNTLIFCF